MDKSLFSNVISNIINNGTTKLLTADEIHDDFSRLTIRCYTPYLGFNSFYGPAEPPLGVSGLPPRVLCVTSAGTENRLQPTVKIG